MHYEEEFSDGFDLGAVEGNGARAFVYVEDIDDGCGFIFENA